MTAQVSRLASYPGAGRRRRSDLLHRKQGIVGLTLLVFVLAIALVGPLIAPHPITLPIGAPGSPPGGGALLGTDSIGRDVLSRVLNGGLPVLALSVPTALMAYCVGITTGMVAGLSGSVLDNLLMRTVDTFMTVPPLLFLLVLIVGAGTSYWVLMVGIAIVLFPGVTRIVRTSTVDVLTTGYMEAAIARGEKIPSLMYREVLPNILPAILADLGVRFSAVVALAASLNFLGLGSNPPAANWGLMVAENQDVLATNIWSVLVPAALLALLTISVNLLGDAYARNLGRSGTQR